MAIGKPGESAMAQAEASRPSSAGIRDGGMRTNGGGQASNSGGNGGYSGNSGNFGSGSMAAARASDRASVAGYSPASRNFTTPSGGGGYAPGLGAAINAGLGVRTPTPAYSGPLPRLNPLRDISKFITPSPNFMQGVSPVVFSKLVNLQEQYGAPLTLTSAHRNPLLNSQVGGVKRSQHMLGNAIDIAIPGATADETGRLLGLASGVGFTGLGGYRPGKVHVDIGATRAWGADTTASSIANLPGPMRQSLNNHLAGLPSTAIASGALSSPKATAPVQANMGAPLATPARTAAPTGPTPITNEAFAQEAVQRLQAAGVDVQRLQVPQAAARPQASPTLASVDRQPPMARPSTVSSGSAMQPLGPVVNVSTLNTYQAPARIGTKVAAVPYNFPTRMPPSKSTTIKTGTNTLAATIPGIGLFNTLASPFGYSAGDAAVWNMNKSLNAPVGSNTSTAPRGSSALANYQSRIGGSERQGGNDRPVGNDASNRQPKSSGKAAKSPKTPDAVWKLAALDNGYTEAQLKDPEIAALIKQLYDMGFLETNTA